ncbi:hypothetical protein, partial [Salmonella enterica]|uniref:hypothetical protein n=1 Tax=Salmonella enterica TaxID=28901 RepID=UPI000CC9ADC7
MAERISRGQGQITLVDLTDSKHLISYISADNQRQVIYDPELDEYQPNFENEPLTLQAELYTVGEPNNIITNAKDITWYRK